MLYFVQSKQFFVVVSVHAMMMRETDRGSWNRVRALRCAGKLTGTAESTPFHNITLCGDGSGYVLDQANR